MSADRSRSSCGASTRSISACAPHTVSPLQRGITVASPAPSMPASVNTPHQQISRNRVLPQRADHPPLGLDGNCDRIGFDVRDFHGVTGQFG